MYVPRGVIATPDPDIVQDYDLDTNWTLKSRFSQQIRFDNITLGYINFVHTHPSCFFNRYTNVGISRPTLVVGY